MQIVVFKKETLTQPLAMFFGLITYIGLGACS